MACHAVDLTAVVNTCINAVNVDVACYGLGSFCHRLFKYDIKSTKVDL